MSEQSYLSEAIRSARRRAGLSQSDLADLLRVRQSSVSQWERGSTKPSTIHLLALAATLRCSLLDFSGAGDLPGTGGNGAATGGVEAARAELGAPAGGAEAARAELGAPGGGADAARAELGAPRGGVAVAERATESVR